MTLIKRGQNWTLVYTAGGRRRWWSTGESDKKLARKKAADFMVAVSEKGWQSVLDYIGKGKQNMSLKQLVDWYDSAPIDVRLRTKHGNIACFTRLVKGCGLTLASPCTAMTPELVSQWLLNQPCRTGANSTLRQARSVASKRHGAPCIPPGLTVRQLKVTSSTYEPPEQHEVQPILQLAAGWRHDRPDLYCAWILAAMCGLRNSECQHARRSWIANRTLTVQKEIDFDPKSYKCRKLPLPDDCTDHLLQHGGPEYILPGKTKTDRDDLMREFNAGIRSTGWSRRMACHELRKLFGSQVATQAGIFAAAKMLGNLPTVAEKSYAGLMELPTYTLYGQARQG